MCMPKNNNNTLQQNKLVYDENVKKFLSQKIILVHILAYAVKEFRGMKPADIVQYIEGTPEVSKHRVGPEGMDMADYNNIKKVYSIWICTNCTLGFENTITEYSM